ncbi:MAG: hypothetical protein LBR78_01850 [Holosporales bacterium]|jgi:RNA-directed DNA polymerase|nr:hypothetical protein [Holosporales bacterium]
MIIEDRVVSSRGEVMSQSEKTRYKWNEINWRKLDIPEIVQNNQRMAESWRYGLGRVFHKMNAGTPQGGVISPLLANIALHGLEYETKKTLSTKLANSLKDKRKYKTSMRDALSSLSIIRYADDFVIIHEDLEIILEAKKFVQEWLKLIGLALNEGKTRITHTLKSIDESQKGIRFSRILDNTNDRMKRCA